MNSNRDVPIAAVFCLASVAAFFAMGWTLAQVLYDWLHRR